MKHITLCERLQVFLNDKVGYSLFGSQMAEYFLLLSGGACLGWNSLLFFDKKKKSQSEVLLFIGVFTVYIFGMQINELAKWWLEIHTCVFDWNLHQDPWSKSIKGNSLWNIQSYAWMGASGPCNSFCLGIPMWQSKWISMTILFLKRLRAAHFYWWISIRTWQKVLWNWLPPPSTWPSGICVSSVYECGHRKCPYQP